MTDTIPWTSDSAGIESSRDGAFSRGTDSPLARYALLAPFTLPELVRATRTLLEAAGVPSLPTERGVRYYIAHGLVDPPRGRGSTTQYQFRHFLQILYVKGRQAAGDTLDHVAAATLNDETLFAAVAHAFGPRILHPEVLLGASGAPCAEERPPTPVPAELVRRLRVAPGVELFVTSAHPLFHHPALDRAVARQVAAVLEHAATADPSCSDS